MNALTNEQLVFIANALGGLTVAWVCLCRLNAATRRTRVAVRLKYTMLLVIALTLAGLPIFFQVRQNWLTFIGIVFVAILVMLEIRLWRYGPPRCSYKRGCDNLTQ